jgi:hypothetical protein
MKPLDEGLQIDIVGEQKCPSDRHRFAGEVSIPAGSLLCLSQRQPLPIRGPRYTRFPFGLRYRLRCF